MMRGKLIILFSIILSGSLLTGAKAQIGMQKIWECTKGLSVPESVIFDSRNDCIYVANIHGKSTEKDSLGYISRISPDGNLLDSAWVAGLHAPKGMAILDSILYVADIDRVVAISTNTARILFIYYGFGARFLNDIAITASGDLFVSDTRQGRIYKLYSIANYIDIHQVMGMTPDNRGHSGLVLWKEDTTLLSRVNGLYSSGDTLFAGTEYGIRAFPDIADPNRHNLIVDSTGFIDGLERFANAWIISDWSGHVTRISGKERSLLLDTSPDKINAADIGIIRKDSVLLIPTFFHNSVSAYRIPK